MVVVSRAAHPSSRLRVGGPVHTISALKEPEENQRDPLSSWSQSEDFIKQIDFRNPHGDLWD